MHEAQHVDTGDLGHVGEHDDRRHGQTPAADPPHPRTECPSAPGEGGAAVRGVCGQFLVRERHQQHRNERDDEHRRGLLVYLVDDVTECRGETVRRRRQSDRDVAEQSDGS